MKLTALKYGQSQIWESVVFEGGNEQNMLPISFLVYLVETGERKILIDGGCVTMADCWKMEHFCGVVPVLQRMGIDPHEITDVIITHAHHDHIETVGSFPRARVYIQELELKNGKPYIPDHMPITTFSEVYPVCDGVRIVKIGGHSIGSCVVEITGDHTTFVVAGDECYSLDCFKRNIPTGASCNRENSVAFLKTYSDPRYTVLLCHDSNILPDQNGFLTIT